MPLQDAGGLASLLMASPPFRCGLPWYSPSVPHIYTGGLMLAGVDEAQGDQAPRMPIMRWTTNIDGSNDPSSSSHIRCAMLRSVMKLSVICVSVPGIGCGVSVI